MLSVTRELEVHCYHLSNAYRMRKGWPVLLLLLFFLLLFLTASHPWAVHF